MVNIDDILVCKKNGYVIISHDGKKMVKEEKNFTNMTKQEIKEWYFKEVKCQGGR